MKSRPPTAFLEKPAVFSGNRDKGQFSGEADERVEEGDKIVDALPS